MITHIVMWRLKASDAEGKAAAPAEIRDALEGLLGRIPQLRSMRVHADALPARGEFDVVMVSEFESEADLDAYAVHPEHQAVVALIRERVNERAAVDFEA
jgi:hypothetical protein